MANNFNIRQLEQALARHGKDIYMKRVPLNAYNEPDGEPVPVCLIRGIIHSSSNYITLLTSEGAQVQTKPTHRILCAWSEVTLLRQGDLTTIGDKDYKVNGVENMQDLGLFAEVSLEVVL